MLPLSYQRRSKDHVPVADQGPRGADGKTIAVSGDSFPSECGAAKKADLATELKGNLEGCLAAFVQHLSCRELNGYAFSTELGREEFEGKLDGQPIKFNTLNTFTATWPQGSCPKPDPVQEITGGCDHYISGENVQGFVRFYDVMPIVGKGGTHFFLCRQLDARLRHWGRTRSSVARR